MDIEDCNRFLSSAETELDATRSFLTQDFLAPFVETFQTVLKRFVELLRGRFSAEISWGGGPRRELQKRYPLHELERKIRIVVPLRNAGPGMATDVRIVVESTNEDVAFSSEPIMLGNVLPGDFSVTLDAMVIEECSEFNEFLSVEWGEIGSPPVNRSY